MDRCQKCGQSAPHLGDSWCLACTATEALSGELRAGWGPSGYRAVVNDLLVSSVRQVRALRRLSLCAGAGPAPGDRAGSTRAHPDIKERESSAAPSHRAPAPPTPPSPPRAVVKEEDEATEESESEDSSEEPEEKPKESDEKAKEPSTTGLPGAFAKSKAHKERSASLPRRRRESPERGGKKEREHKEKKRERDQERSPRKERKHRPREDHEDRSKKEKKDKHKKTRRAGSKHQRLWRASTVPFKRFHHRQPESFWDSAPTLRD